VVGKNFARKSKYLNDAGFPCIPWQTGLSTCFRKEIFVSEVVFYGNLRKQKPSPAFASGDQAVFAKLNLRRLDWRKLRKQ
jgi:hypothetical protein